MHLLTLLPLLCCIMPMQAHGQSSLIDQPLSTTVLLAPAPQNINLSARVTQTGSDNQLLLSQEDPTSIADLEQHGDRNAMTVRQLGGDNRLSWRQIGSDLPDLRVVQSGAMALSIVQTGPAH